MANPRRVFPVTVFGLLAILAWWLFDEQRPVQQRPEKAQAAYFFRDFHLHVTGSDGHAEYDLRGKHMIHYEQSDVSLLERPAWTVYMPTGAPWYGRSDDARAAAGGRKVQLRGNVRLHRPSTSANPAITLETQRLNLHPREDYADTDTPVTIYGKDFRVNATGARAWMHKQRVELLAEVKGYYEVSTH